MYLVSERKMPARYVCPPSGCVDGGKTFEEPGRCPDCGMELIESEKVRRVAIVIWNGVELLDFSGPGEVFAATRGEQGECFRVYTVSSSTSPVTSQGFLKVLPNFSIVDCPQPDIVLLPGGGTATLENDEPLMTWINQAVEVSEVTLSVCTGVFALAQLGFLEGQKATTWHGAIDRLQQLHPTVEVQADRRFIDNGKVITSAGVSAGIDSSLHLVARLLGKPTAVRTAQYMEYHWRFADE